MHELANQDASKLFHLLFDKIFPDPKEVENSVAFGGKCGVPKGKHLLDQKKFDAIMRKYAALIGSAS